MVFYKCNEYSLLYQSISLDVLDQGNFQSLIVKDPIYITDIYYA